MVLNSLTLNSRPLIFCLFRDISPQSLSSIKIVSFLVSWILMVYFSFHGLMKAIPHASLSTCLLPIFQGSTMWLRCPEPLTILLLLCKWAYFISLGFITTFWDKSCKRPYPMLPTRKWRLTRLNPSSGLFWVDKLFHTLGTHSTLPHNIIFLCAYDLSSQLNFLKSTHFIGLSLGSPPCDLNRKGTQ